MDKLISSACESGQAPKLTCSTTIKLTPAQERLLLQAFWDNKEVYVERVFDSGYSGASVYLVTCDHGPVVVKMARPSLIQQEYEAYWEYIRPKNSLNIVSRIERAPISS